MLETKRLVLRNFKDTDINELFEYRNHPKCNLYQRYDDTSKSYLKKFITANKNNIFLSPKEQHLAITLKSGELVGDLSIFFKNITITLGYTISYKHQRKGYAFEILSKVIEVIHNKYSNYEIVAMVDKDNIASIGLLEKLEFKNEGYEEKIKSYIYSLYAL